MRFLGNKESIVMQIRDLMSRKSLLNRGLVLFDAFCGAGSVSDELKDCFDLVVNDIMNWSVLYTKGRIYSVSCTFEHLGFDPFEYLNASVRKRHGFIYVDAIRGFWREGHYDAMSTYSTENEG